MADDASNPARPVPLCVDLDGTLLRTDMLHEVTLELLKRAPLSLARLPGWLAQGKAAMKHRISEIVEVEVSHLPYRREVLDLIEEARAEGRPVVLATASSTQIAEAVARHLGLFDMVLASDAVTNLSAEAKAERLVAAFGEAGFDYVGNGSADLPVWRRARRVIVVSRDGRLYARAGAQGQDCHRIADPKPSLYNWLRCLRPHQWLKNLLVFVPLVAGHEAGDPVLFLQAVLAFVAFSLAASAVYIVNDLVDLPSDRRHRSKHKRPFASGALPIAGGVIAAPLLLLAALLVSLFLPLPFLGVLAFYLVLTSLYSFWLKRQVLVDVMLLAGLYTLRIIAGSAATGIVPSFWLLAFSMFVFLSLALVKRHQELHQAAEDGALLAGRGYMRTDLPVLMALGAGSGLMSVMVIALYIDSPTVAASYAEPVWLWLVPPVMLYWTGRLWMKAQRGQIHDDPVVFAVRDRQSQIIAAAIAIVTYAAMAGLRFW
jgi:4-hydroxybenzoate polyprenyltransferase/phosphoserine phosphatase